MKLRADKGIAIDHTGYLYVTGYTGGAFDGQNKIGSNDIFLTRLDDEGNRVWTQLRGNYWGDAGHAVAVDSSNNAYVSATTTNNRGDLDAVVLKVSPYGERLWHKKLDSGQKDYALSVAVNAKDEAYIGGFTHGNLADFTSAGLTDLFMARFSSDGAKMQLKQWGSDKNDVMYSIHARHNRIYISGITRGYLDGSVNNGDFDFFFSRFIALPTFGLPTN